MKAGRDIYHTSARYVKSVCLCQSRVEHFSSGEEKMKQTSNSFVVMEVPKATISISVAENGRNGAVRFFGVIPKTVGGVAKMAKRPAKHDGTRLLLRGKWMPVWHSSPTDCARSSVWSRHR